MDSILEMFWSSSSMDIEALLAYDDLPLTTGNSSWPELMQNVCNLRRRLSSLSTTTAVPSNLDFRLLSDGRIRIYFLCTPNTGWETTLLYVDIHPNDTGNARSRKLVWQHAFEANFHGSSGTRFSREEQLLSERKRLATWGITSYELHPESGILVFPVASSLYQCVDPGNMNGPLFPAELKMNSTGAKLSPQICPTNPELVAYLCNLDLWVSHPLTGNNVRLTFAHKGGRSLSEDPLSAGVPSYIMQEEFCRYQGFWWQPINVDGYYRIVYEEVDESDVNIFCFPSTNSNCGEIEEFRFPRAGTPNSKSNLKLIQFKLSKKNQIEDVKTLELQYPLSVMFPWAEYLVRIGWLPNAQQLWLQLLDRRQKRLDLILLPLENFVEAHSADHSPTPPPQILYSERSDIWVNVHDSLYIFPSTPGDNTNELRFIWASEETGFRHLYLITVHLSEHLNGIEESYERLESMQPRVTNKMALTSGEWEVIGKVIWVDVSHSLVYFLGLRETPLEKHLYVVSLDRPGEVRLLTKLGYSYSVDFNKECSMLVALYSNIEELPVCQAMSVYVSPADQSIQGVTLTSVGFLIEPSVPESDIYTPRLYNYQISSGDVLHAMVFKPHSFEPNKKYPCVLNVYGGPEVQLVSNTFKGMRQLRLHMLAAHGYCVVAIDSRGSQHRGILFESHLKDRMGTVELLDQVEVLKWLADTLGFIDMQRIAIHGWSYGGYLSLMAIAKHPDIFKVAIAGAPVTSWHLYDTGYTERYMDLPDQNPSGYKNGSILSHINKFPDRENRLLIIHGLIDENVHFFHTSQFINALVRAGKPYQLQIYPNERHSLRHLEASKHYETTLLSFLKNNL